MGVNIEYDERSRRRSRLYVHGQPGYVKSNVKVGTERFLNF
jgi:hypothetical protein